MIESIEKWGIPEALKGEFEFRFDGEVSYYKGREYNGSAGFFCLWDIINQREVIVIDLWAEKGTALQMLGGSELPKLEVLHIPFEEYRRKGVARFYMKKLVKYLEDDGDAGLRVLANRDAELFKNNKSKFDMNNEQLKLFYKEFDTDTFQIVLL